MRAEHAVALARIEQRLAGAQALAAKAKAETGERLKVETGLLETIAAEQRRIVAAEAEIGALKVEIQTRDLRIGELVEARDLGLSTISGLEAQRDGLASRLAQTVDLAENRRVALDEALGALERMREAHAQETQRNARLRSEVQQRQTEAREAERRLAELENNAVLARIRGGEETYQSALVQEQQRQAG